MSSIPSAAARADGIGRMDSAVLTAARKSFGLRSQPHQGLPERSWILCVGCEHQRVLAELAGIGPNQLVDPASTARMTISALARMTKRLNGPARPVFRDEALEQVRPVRGVQHPPGHRSPTCALNLAIPVIETQAGLSLRDGTGRRPPLRRLMLDLARQLLQGIKVVIRTQSHAPALVITHRYRDHAFSDHEFALLSRTFHIPVLAIVCTASWSPPPPAGPER